MNIIDRFHILYLGDDTIQDGIELTENMPIHPTDGHQNWGYAEILLELHLNKRLQYNSRLDTQWILLTDDRYKFLDYGVVYYSLNNNIPTTYLLRTQTTLFRFHVQFVDAMARNGMPYGTNGYRRIKLALYQALRNGLTVNDYVALEKL